MKKQFFYLICIFALGLNSCSPAKASVVNGKASQNDDLAYIQDHQLFFYDPESNAYTPILPGWEIYAFSLSANNRLAFSSAQNGNNSIYILEYPFTQNTPTEITPDKASENTSPSWSPDGRYLLFDSVRADGKKLVLWDGNHFLDLYHHEGEIREITWNSSDQLAFTEFLDNEHSSGKDPAEVYIWDGNAVVSASQNPSGEDRFPAWSQDGQLAFLSNRNGEYDIFVWDGTSKQNGLPDINTFVNVAPELTRYFSIPTWTNVNSLAFEAQTKLDSQVQIYEWDGQTAKNISKNQLAHNGSPAWRKDGYWSFTTFFSASQNLYIRDEANRTVLETRGEYRPIWSRSGRLIFCSQDDSHRWTLSMWSGGNVVEIAHGNFIEANWNGGEPVYCSSG
jgi:Tol biopolymer transport system component